MKKGRISQASDEDMKKIVSESFSYAECLRKLGYIAISGKVCKQLKERIEQLQLSISHFESSMRVKRTRENVFTENSTVDQKVLRNWYLKENIDYKCSICGQEPFWNGKEMIMILDHINGKNHDNRLENLRWVCANCNVQLPTYGSKNKKMQKEYFIVLEQRLPREKYACPQCGGETERKGRRCEECKSKILKTNYPDFVTLAKMVKEQGFERTGAQYNVSGKAVQKRFQKAGLPYHKKDIANWYDQKVGVEPKQSKVRTPIEQIVRPVHQIDIITNKIIKTFPNAAEAARSLNKENASHISSVCKGKRKSAYSFKWAYADNE